MRLAYGVNYTISMVIVTVVIVYHAHYCFCVGFLFSCIPTYINAFYFLQSRQIKSFQPTGSSSAIRSNSGKRVPAVELTIKSFVNFLKFLRGRRSGVIRTDLINIVEEFLNATKCKSMSEVKHQTSCRFIVGEF